jgi:hypothetical protein
MTAVFAQKKTVHTAERNVNSYINQSIVLIDFDNEIVR